MISYGGAALILFFTITFVLQTTAGFLNNANIEGQTGMTQYYNKTYGEPEGGLFANIMSQFISPEAIAATGLFAVVAVGTGNIAIAFAAAAVGFLALYFLTPFAVIRAIGLPSPFDWLLFGFMNMLLLLAMFSFIRGKDL